MDIFVAKDTIAISMCYVAASVCPFDCPPFSRVLVTCHYLSPCLVKLHLACALIPWPCPMHMPRALPPCTCPVPLPRSLCPVPLSHALAPCSGLFPCLVPLPIALALPMHLPRDLFPSPCPVHLTLHLARAWGKEHKVRKVDKRVWAGM